MQVLIHVVIRFTHTNIMSSPRSEQIFYHALYPNGNLLTMSFIWFFLIETLSSWRIFNGILIDPDRLLCIWRIFLKPSITSQKSARPLGHGLCWNFQRCFLTSKYKIKFLKTNRSNSSKRSISILKIQSILVLFLAYMAGIRLLQKRKLNERRQALV